MREILFRGKDSKGLWHTGLLAYIDNTWYISNGSGIYTDFTAFDAIPETIGQYIGLTDKNGVKIFEGDIVRHYSGRKIEDDVGKIFYDVKKCKFLRTSKTNPKIHYELHADCVYEVIGNIYDNPELVEGLL